MNPRLSRILLLALILLIPGGCATMNQSECLTADWQMIGIEDGSYGRPLSYIGNHRKSCAEYGVTPDMMRYEEGHAQGVRRFCTYRKGFQLGQKGKAFHEICPPDLVDKFRIGYQRGREIHAMNVEIRKVQKTIKELVATLKDLDADVAEMEELIISRKTREVERALLLIDIKNAQTEIGRLEVELDLLEQEKARRIYDRDILRQEYANEPR